MDISEPVSAMHIPDPIEIGDSAMERWADENCVGDNFICSCGQQCKLDEGVFIYPNPYAPPVCPDCADAALRTGADTPMSESPLHDELYDACANHPMVPVSIFVNPKFLTELLNEPMSPGAYLCGTAGAYLCGTDGWKFHGLPLKPHSGIERFEIERASSLRR